MSKKVLLIAVLLLICGTLWACDSDDAHSVNPPEDKCENDGQCAEPDAGTRKACFRISGVKICKDECLGKNEGKNEPVCYLPSTFAPPPKPNYSVIDTCAKDDDGRLYVVDSISDHCPNYCDEATGLCNGGDTPVTTCSDQDNTNCNPPGSDPKVCTIISGQKGCSESCYGNAEGENAPVCYSNSSLDPSIAPQYSIVSTCKISWFSSSSIYTSIAFIFMRT